mmetsp:Transcript_15360/g.30841  ORF Transcript_15360/g.30841 Transcript_15360/m.30841 type:complete len:261 (-) Transcript_15360:136-918(-)
MHEEPDHTPSATASVHAQPQFRVPRSPRHMGSPTPPWKPPPWTLHGRGWIFVTTSSASANRDAHIPSELQDSYHAAFNLFMGVNYQDSPVGPYHELLYIPGTFLFKGRGTRHASITTIFVSSLDSLVNGQRNWGIPKQLASFNVTSLKDGAEQWELRQPTDEIPFASFRVHPNSWSPTFPIKIGKDEGRHIPPLHDLLQLAQLWNKSEYYFTPFGNGSARTAQLEAGIFNASVFPDMATRAVHLGLKVEPFQLVFPTLDL